MDKIRNGSWNWIIVVLLFVVMYGCAGLKTARYNEKFNNATKESQTEVYELLDNLQVYPKSEYLGWKARYDDVQTHLSVLYDQAKSIDNNEPTLQILLGIKDNIEKVRLLHQRGELNTELMRLNAKAISTQYVSLLKLEEEKIR